MEQTILTHHFENGLVLLAEPMDWLESAAFAILVPAGSWFVGRKCGPSKTIWHSA